MLNFTLHNIVCLIEHHRAFWNIQIIQQYVKYYWSNLIRIKFKLSHSKILIQTYHSRQRWKQILNHCGYEHTLSHCIFQFLQAVVPTNLWGNEYQDIRFDPALNLWLFGYLIRLMKPVAWILHMRKWVRRCWTIPTVNMGIGQVSNHYSRWVVHSEHFLGFFKSFKSSEQQMIPSLPAFYMYG